MDILPEDNTEYGRREYWDQRYEKEGADAAFDWFRRYADIRAEIRECIPDGNAKILMLGCGNSTLSQDMYDDGFENISNLDYSAVCIRNMQAQHRKQRPRMTWLEGDVRNLPFEADSFDVLLDKGTMDAMMTSKGDVWNPPEADIENCTKEVNEALRVLRPGGLFLYITFGQPHFRKRYLSRSDTTLSIRELKTQGFSYFLYQMRKAP